MIHVLGLLAEVCSLADSCNVEDVKHFQYSRCKCTRIEDSSRDYDIASWDLSDVWLAIPSTVTATVEVCPNDAQ